MTMDEGARNALDSYMDRQSRERRDLEARVGMLEAQVDTLCRALVLSLASAGPGIEWMQASWPGEGKNE